MSLRTKQLVLLPLDHALRLIGRLHRTSETTRLQLLTSGVLYGGLLPNTKPSDSKKWRKLFYPMHGITKTNTLCTLQVILSRKTVSYAQYRGMHLQENFIIASFPMNPVDVHALQDTNLKLTSSRNVLSIFHTLLLWFPFILHTKTLRKFLPSLKIFH